MPLGEPVITRPLPLPAAHTTDAKILSSGPVRWAGLVVLVIMGWSATFAQQQMGTAAAGPANRDSHIVAGSEFATAPQPAAPPHVEAGPQVGVSSTAPVAVAPQDTAPSVPPLELEIVPAPAPAAAPVAARAPAPARAAEGAPADVLNLIAQARLAVQSARQQVNQLEGSVKAVDTSIAAATAARDAAAAAETGSQGSVDPQTRAALERAQVAYNEAVARERRASALEAHGVAASQELEEAQMAVRAAAAEVAALRRSVDASNALATAQVVQTRAQADAAIAEQQRIRQQRNDELVQARLRLRQAEAVLAAATREAGTNARGAAETPRNH